MMALVSLSIGLVLGAVFGFLFGRCSSRNDEDREKGKRRKDSCASQENRDEKGGTAHSRIDTSVSSYSSDGELGTVYGLGGYSQSSRVLLCMVGLPARGKSYITKMLMRYLTWSGFPVKSFNAGNLRRQGGNAGASAQFFSSTEEATKRREAIADACMAEAIEWLRMHKSDSLLHKRTQWEWRSVVAHDMKLAIFEVCVAIFDATNTTKRRRQRLIDRCRQVTGITAVFVESICDNKDMHNSSAADSRGRASDKHYVRIAFSLAELLAISLLVSVVHEPVLAQEILERNYSLKLANDDYRTMDPAKARADFIQRLQEYETRYQTVADTEDGGEICYIKLFNVGQKVEMHHCSGYLMSILGSHRGELTKNGRNYCRELSAFLRKCRREMEEAGQVETSGDILVLMGTAPVHYSTLQAMMMRGSAAARVIPPQIIVSGSGQLDKRHGKTSNVFVVEPIDAERDSRECIFPSFAPDAPANVFLARSCLMLHCLTTSDLLVWALH
eukprot:s196_g15.t1